jgi:hypothetical protein
MEGRYRGWCSDVKSTVPLSCDASTRNSLRERAGISRLRYCLRRMCWLRSMRGLLARRGSSGLGLWVEGAAVSGLTMKERGGVDWGEQR